jgi:hypothetical protein
MFTLGKGATNSYSRKVKLNTRCSMETELVTADMYMPEMLWLLYFIQNQGYEPECVELYHDNISTQLLIKNGKNFQWEENKTCESEVLLYQGSGGQWGYQGH